MALGGVNIGDCQMLLINKYTASAWHIFNLALEYGLEISISIKLHYY